VLIGLVIAAIIAILSSLGITKLTDFSLIPTWGLALILWFLLLVFVITPLRAWKDLHCKYEKKAVELLYDEATCCRKYYLQGGSLIRFVYMVGIRAVGKITLNDVEVSLVGIDPLPWDSDFLQFVPEALNPKDSSGQGSSRFSVNPSKDASAFVEVFSWDNKVKDEIGIHFYINYHNSARKIPSSFSRRDYRLTLRATGRDMPSYDKDFEIHMGKKGAPKFREISQ